MKTATKYFLVIAGLLEALIFSGCLFGWPSLLLTLQKEGIYSHLCPENFNTTSAIISNSGCDAQRVYMTLIFTVAAVAYGVAAVLIGISLEWMGLWVTRSVGSCMTFAGFLFMAYITPDRSYFLWPALVLVALGSNQLRLSCFQLVDIWPAYRATILTLYSSAYSISTTFFIGVQMLYEHNVDFKLVMLITSGIAALTIIPTCFMPRSKIVPPSSVTKKLDEGEQMIGLKGKETKSKTSSLETEKEKASGCWQYVFSLSGILHMYWHFMNMWMILFYSASFNIWMGKVTQDENKVSFYIKMTGLCALVAPIFVPIVGVATDCLIKRAQTRRNPVTKLAHTMQAPTYPMFGATVIVIVTIVCKLFFTETAVYTSIILIALARPAVIGSCTSYIKLRFPDKHFNILNGVFTTVISVLCLVQYPVMEWMTRSDCAYTQVHVNILIFLGISLLSPIHMMITRNAKDYAQEMLKAEKGST